MRGDAIRAGERRLFVNYPRGITGFALFDSGKLPRRPISTYKFSRIWFVPDQLWFPPSGEPNLRDYFFWPPFLSAAFKSTWLNLNALFFFFHANICVIRPIAPGNYPAGYSRDHVCTFTVVDHFCVSRRLKRQFLSPSLLTGIDKCIFYVLAPINRSIKWSRCSGETNIILSARSIALSACDISFRAIRATWIDYLTITIKYSLTHAIVVY